MLNDNVYLVVFYLSLVLAVAALANPHRHFEVYLGQWSISGPGRAFRILPMLDGKLYWGVPVKRQNNFNNRYLTNIIYDEVKLRLVF